MKRFEIATPAEIRAIYERTAALFDTPLELGEDIDHAERRRQLRELGRYAIEALRFCANAIASHPDPSLAPIVVDLVQRLDRAGDDAERRRRLAHRALSTLLAAGLPVDAAIRELAASTDEALREQIALGLDPARESARALLEQLAADPAARVRAAAKKALAKLAALPWWLGKWRRDPAAHLRPEEAEACGPPLQRVSQILDEPPHRILHPDHEPLAPELIEHLAKLPDELAVEALELLCGALPAHYLTLAAPLLAHLASRAGGVDALVRLIQQWGCDEHVHGRQIDLDRILPQLPRDARLALCQRLLLFACQAPWEERSRSGTPAWLAAAIVGSAWPPDADVTSPLLAALALGAEEIERGGTETDYVRSEIADALSIEGMDPTPVLKHLCAARLAGYPGPWRGLASDADRLLDRAPRDVLRVTAERALQGADPGTLRWAALRLLGAARDPDRDGPATEQAAALFANPRLRAALFGDGELVVRALPYLREELLRDALSWPEAVDVLEGIHDLYGGLADGSRYVAGSLAVADAPETKPEEARREAREAVADFLGPPERRGPPTEAEWAALARARDAYRAEDEGERAELFRLALREGPWTAEERAEFDAFLARVAPGDEEDLTVPLASAVLAKPALDLLPAMDRLVACAGPHARPLVKQYRADVYTALGVPLPPKPAEGGDALPGSGWDDEDEEDSWDEDEDER
jgi:hypothetical protein